LLPLSRKILEHPFHNQHIAHLEKSTKETIEALSSGPVRKYIADHENSDIRKIILKHKEILGIPTTQLLDQISTRRKAKDKLPLYYHNDGVVYPPPENFEQSSSESTAVFKSNLVRGLPNSGSFKGADLSGGFGVDTYFLSRVVQTMHYVEPQRSLLDLAAHNHRLLGAANIEYHNTTAEQFITGADTFDLIYVDPSRRTESKKKIFSLEESQPPILSIADIIFSKARWLMVKASPLFDIQAGIRKIPFVSEVYIVAVNNECKEILFVSEKGCLAIPQIKAVNIDPSGTTNMFTFTFEEEREAQIAFSEPRTYLYEPNAAILKAGAFKTVGNRHRLQKIHPSTHLYTADQDVGQFPGRTFLIEALVRPEPAELKKYFPDGKANVTTRNYPVAPEALKKRMGLEDGGEKFLIGFSGQKKKYLAVAKRV